MSIGRKVWFGKKRVLSVLVATFLAGWVVVPISEATFQSNFFMSANGTGYFAFRDDGATGDPVQVTGLALGARTTAAGGVNATTSANPGNPLDANVTIDTLFNPALVRHTGLLTGCTLPGTFNATAFGNLGSWDVGDGGGVISLSGNTRLPNTLSVGGGNVPAADTTPGTKYRFGGIAPTTTVALGAALPTDGIATTPNLVTLGKCIVFALDSSSLLTPGNTLEGAGAVSGFLAKPAPGDSQCATGTACATAAKQDNTSVFLATTTTTTTTTTSTTTTTTTTTSTTTSTTTTTVPKVPTATPWGMMILGLALLGAIGWMLQARRSLR